MAREGVSQMIVMSMSRIEVQMVVSVFETSITSSNHQRNEDNTQLHR